MSLDKRNIWFHYLNTKSNNFLLSCIQIKFPEDRLMCVRTLACFCRIVSGNYYYKAKCLIHCGPLLMKEHQNNIFCLPALCADWWLHSNLTSARNRLEKPLQSRCGFWITGIRTERNYDQHPLQWEFELRFRLYNPLSIKTDNHLKSTKNDKLWLMS